MRTALMPSHGRVCFGRDRMPRLRVHNASVSIDGHAVGPGQSLEHPLGHGGERLHEWLFATRSARRTHGMDGGEARGIDDERMARGEDGIGAALDRAFDAAGGADVRVGGGPDTIRQHLRAG